jgi:hypothetical protein
VGTPTQHVQQPCEASRRRVQLGRARESASSHTVPQRLHLRAGVAVRVSHRSCGLGLGL